MIQYTQWYRALGVRIAAGITDPTLRPLSELYFPLNSALHMLTAVGSGEDDTSDDHVILGPSVDDPLLVQHQSHALLIRPIMQYMNKDIVGKPILKVTTGPTLLAKYIGSNSRILKLTPGRAEANTATNLLIYTYTAFENMYRYQYALRSNWFSWYNHYATVLTSVSAACAEFPNRNHFIVLEPPPTLPSLSNLNMMRDRIDLNTDPKRVDKDKQHYLDLIDDKFIKMIKTDSERTFVDLWLFLGNGRRHSLIGKMIPPDIRSKVNLIWQVGGQWMCVNLAILDGFVTRPDNLNGKFSEDRMAKIFLAFMFRMDVSHAGGSLPAAEDNLALDPVSRISAQDKPVHILNADATEIKAAENKINIDIILDANKSKVKLSDSDALESLKQQLVAADKEKVSDEVATDEVADEIIQAAIDRDIDQLESISAQRVIEDSYANRYTAYTPPPESHEDAVYAIVDKMALRGTMSPKEVARVKNAAIRYKEIKDPIKGLETIAKAMVIDPEMLVVAETNIIAKNVKGVVDKGMLSSSITHMEKNYIEKVMPKDILNAIMHPQKAGYPVQDYKVEKVRDVLSEYDVHTVTIMTPKGVTKNCTIQIPKINPDSVYYVGGVKYRMRPQNADLPIRKVGPSRVAMTSYISKIFITRTDRVAFNYSMWIVASIRDMILNPENTLLADVNYGDCFVMDVTFPRAYSAMAGDFISMKYNGFKLSFDYSKIVETFPDNVIMLAKKTRMIPFGVGAIGTLFMDMKNSIFLHMPTGEVKPLGSFESFFNMQAEKAPIDYAEFPLLGDTVPLGIILGYHAGLGNLLATLDSKVRRVSRGSSYNLQPHEYIVKFQDEALIFDRADMKTSLLMQGFNQYKNTISKMSVYHFDNPEIYGTLLEAQKIHSSKLLEVDALFDMWVDGITLGLLKEMNMPTDLFNLLLTATEMLTTDAHSEPIDAAFQRTRGQERIAGAIYAELYKAIRAHRSQSVMMQRGVDLNPMAVWYNLLNDTASMGVEESNPVHFLKEQEELIVGGSGGRTTRTLTANDRRFHKNAMGVISEASVDSGEVAAKVFRTADPNYDSLRGTTRRLNGTKGNATKMWSTSVLLAPAAEYDHPNRKNFINIQNSSTTWAKGYTAMPMRTGYESVVPHRIINDMWASTAEQDGVVDSIRNNILSVRYKDGSLRPIELGIIHGKWSGKIVPHEIVTDLKVGDTFVAGTPIARNRNWFKRNHLYPDQIILAFGVLATVVIWESDDTYEDGMAMTSGLAKKLETRFSENRSIRVPFDHDIRGLVKVGDKVDGEDLLCTLFPPLSTSSDRYDEVAQNVLAKLSNESPRAKVTGVIESISILYSGDLESMSPSLRHLVEAYDDSLYRKCKQLKKTPHDASVYASVQVEGQEIGNDQVIIQVKIGKELGVGGGDKFVLGPQMKSVNGRIIDGIIRTKSGLKIDMVFGAQSMESRMVRSIQYQCMTNRILVHLGNEMVDAYFN